jgi:Terpene cyclase DEP1
MMSAEDFDAAVVGGSVALHSRESLPALLALDLSIAFVAFALWAAWEGQRLEMRSWWVPVPASPLVGLCLALPLFLLLRERAVRKRPTRRKDTGMNRAFPKATP